MDLVEFDQVVARMEIRADIVQSRSPRQAGDLMPSDRSAKFPPLSREEVGHASGNDHPGIGCVVDQIVCHAVLTALPDHDPRRMGINPAYVVNMVVVNKVLSIHVFGAGAVAAE